MRNDAETCWRKTQHVLRATLPDHIPCCKEYQLGCECFFHVQCYLPKHKPVTANDVLSVEPFFRGSKNLCWMEKGNNCIKQWLIPHFFWFCCQQIVFSFWLTMWVDLQQWQADAVFVYVAYTHTQNIMHPDNWKNVQPRMTTAHIIVQRVRSVIFFH